MNYKKIRLIIGILLLLPFPIIFFATHGDMVPLLMLGWFIVLMVLLGIEKIVKWTLGIGGHKAH